MSLPLESGHVGLCTSVSLPLKSSRVFTEAAHMGVTAGVTGPMMGISPHLLPQAGRSQWPAALCSNLVSGGAQRPPTHPPRLCQVALSRQLE